MTNVAVDPPADARVFDEVRLREELVARWPSFDAPVVVLAIAGSTNDELKSRAAAGAPALTVCVAEMQTAGRGRAGRSWHSPPGENLYLSFLLRPGWDAAKAVPFALVVGLAVAEEVDLRLGPPTGQRLARVKWPNDVLVAGRKLGGVLLEASIQRGRVASLVVGVGVDVSTRSFPGALALSATSLALLGALDLDRASLAAGIVARTARFADRFASEGLGGFLGELRARDPLLGTTVVTPQGNGVARGVAEDGRLRVELEDGRIEAVGVGDVVPAGDSSP